MKKKNFDKRITIRLDDDLYNKIANGAQAGGISQVEFARRLLRKGKVVVTQEIIADVPELKKLIAEFGKIGSNLNQIARHYNGGGARSREMYDHVQQAISALFAMKYEVEKMGGDFRGYSQAHQKEVLKPVSKERKTLRTVQANMDSILGVQNEKQIEAVHG